MEILAYCLAILISFTIIANGFVFLFFNILSFSTALLSSALHNKLNPPTPLMATILPFLRYLMAFDKSVLSLAPQLLQAIGSAKNLLSFIFKYSFSQALHIVNSLIEVFALS